MARVLILALALLAVAAGQAHARRAVCEPEELVSRLPSRLASIVEVAPNAAPPMETNYCLPGVGGAAGCWPDEPLPGPTGSGIPLLQESFVLVKAPALPPPPSQLHPLDPMRAASLAPGHERRIERPPRSA